MINQKTNFPNYSRSLLFEFYCYDDEMTKKNSNSRFHSLIYIYMKINFNKNGFDTLLSETKLDIDQ